MRRYLILFVSALVITFGGASVAHSEQRAADALAYTALYEYDRNLPLNVEEKPSSPESGGTLYKLTYKSVHDQLVPALLLIPPLKEGQKVPCVIIGHGLGGDKESLKPLWGAFVAQGYALFMIDAPYHGERAIKGESPQKNFQYPYRTREGFIQAVIDLRRGLDYLASRKEIDSDRIGYLGLSMGSIIGTIFAGVDDRVKAPIFMVGGADWKLIAKSSLNLTPKTDDTVLTQYAEILRPVDPIVWVGRISPRPVLMINGDQDTIVPVEANKALQAAAKEPKEIYWYKGGHLPPNDQWLGVSLKISGWLAKNLKGSSVPNEPSPK